MNKYAVIVAGGKGQRMGSAVPKQFLPIGGVPVLMRTLQTFYAYDAAITLILVLPDSQRTYWQSLCEEYGFRVPHRVVCGGETRFHSVKNGLDSIAEEPEALVAVHDGVRPFVGRGVIDSCFEAAAQGGAAIPVVDVVETVRRLTSTGESRTVNRSDYRLVQTPQVFSLQLLRRAYAQPYAPCFTDDASVVEALGEKVALVEGNRENIKITTPYDIKVANALL